MTIWRTRSLEFRHADAERLKSALIDIAAHAAMLDAEALKAELAARNLTEAMQRIVLSITTPSLGRAAGGRAGRRFAT
jgi:hypothetical protein